MGYIAITSDKQIEIEKISDCIVLGSTIIPGCSANYVFFELEGMLPEADSGPNFKISIYVPGKISILKQGSNVTNNPNFSEWYYSQKAMVRKQGGILNLNGIDTMLLTPCLESSYNKHNNVTEIILGFLSDQARRDQCTRWMACFTFETSHNLSKTFGTVTIQSRYYDRKECPYGDFFENTVLSGVILSPKSIYCWMIAKPGCYLANYTNFGLTQPRDIRIIEPAYIEILSNKPWYKRCLLKAACWILGYPQVINWRLDKNLITFRDSYREHKKWDEIRLFATFKGFELSSVFIALSAIASLLGFIFYVIEKLPK